MRHSLGIRFWCDQVYNLHGMEGFRERSISWVLAFWVAGFGRSETEKRRFLPSFSWGPVSGGVRCCSDGRGSTVPVSPTCGPHRSAPVLKGLERRTMGVRRGPARQVPSGGEIFLNGLCDAVKARGRRNGERLERMECLKSGHPMPALFPREPCPVCACAMAHAGKDQARGAEMATLAGNSICIAIWEEIYGLIHVAAPGRGAAGAKISSRGPLPDAATWISPSIASRALTIDNTNRNSRV